MMQPASPHPIGTIAILVVCFLIGIARSFDKRSPWSDASPARPRHTAADF